MKIIGITTLSVVLGVILGALSGCVTTTKFHATDGNATIGFERTMDTGDARDTGNGTAQ